MLRSMPLLLLASFLAMPAAPAAPADAPAEEWKLPPEITQLKKGDGRELVAGQCLLCHSADYITTQPPLTRAQWQAGVDKMRAKYGAPIPTNTVPALVDYLTTAYGRPTPAR